MTKATRLKRTRQTIAALFYLAIIVGLSWLTLTRWNGVPADPTGASASLPLDPATDRTNELVAALAAFPPIPALTIPPPPPGMQWSLVNVAGSPLEIGDALRGEWTPETRPNLQGVITYLESQPVQDAIDALAAIEPGRCRSGSINMSALRHATRACIARARLRHAALGDIDGAMNDIETTYNISLTCFNSGDSLLIWTSYGCLGVASNELHRMAYEHAFTRAQANRAMQIAKNATRKKEALWKQITSAECDGRRRALDMFYTDDGRGNGWLVLSHIGNVPQQSPSITPRSRIWNLFSPLFNDRQTVETKLDRYTRAHEKIGRLSYTDAKAAIPVVESHARSFGILDGPLGHGMRTFASSHHKLTTEYLIAARGADIAAAAISAYHRDHGEYPLSLEAILGDYLETLPRDPYVDQPLKYSREPAGDDYILYAVGPNQTDDGGNWSRANSENPEDDRIFDHARGDTSSEPTLEAITP